MFSNFCQYIIGKIEKQADMIFLCGEKTVDNGEKTGC